MALKFGLVAHHRIFDVFGDLLERLGLVVVRVGIDDQEVFVLAHDRLIDGVAQQRAGVELLAGEIAEIAVGQVLQMIWIGQHEGPRYFRYLIAAAVRRETADARHRLPGAEFEHFKTCAFEQRGAADGDVGDGDA